MSDNNGPILVSVIGDSLPLPRQFQGLEFHQTYPYLLTAWLREQGNLAEVWGMAHAGSPIRKILGQYDEYRTYVGPQVSGIGIAHLGIVDCSPRPVPFWIRNIIGQFPEPLRKLSFKFLHNYRIPLLRYGPGFLLTRPDAFRRAYRQLLERMTADFSHVYAVNIIPAGPYFESRSPSVSQWIEKYNRIIAEVVDAVECVDLIDIWAGCKELDADEDLVSPFDGHHLSPAGHRRLFELIIDGRAVDQVVSPQTAHT